MALLHLVVLLVQLLPLFISIVHSNVVRIDCHPESSNVTAMECEKRGCVFDAKPSTQSTPKCIFPPGTGYALDAQISQSKFRLRKSTKSPPNPFGRDIEPLYLETNNIGKTFNVRIGIPGRYEPPLDLPKQPSISSDELIFRYQSGDIFTFMITRASNKNNIWDTSIGGLLFADQYIQIATLLPSDRVYGFGEHCKDNLKHNLSDFRTWPMFARDNGPDWGIGNKYGVHPFYLALEKDGKAHGVLFLNSNAQEVTLGPGPFLIYRTIGGMLDLYFFPGPSPEEVIQQYLALIGTPYLPAYWALGFQLSRDGYKDLNDMKTVIRRNRKARIPLDVVFGDIDYMEGWRDFTIGQNWTKLGVYVNQLHGYGMRVILIVDAAIAVDYDPMKRAMQMNASFVEWPRYDLVPQSIQRLYPLIKDSKIMLGIVWPSANVAFPDFLDPSNATLRWWTNELRIFHQKVQFDSIWLDMNEPSNYYGSSDWPQLRPLTCPKKDSKDSKFDWPPYCTAAGYSYKDGLADQTLCMFARSARDTLNHYDTHNLYGWSELRVSYQAMATVTGKRGGIIPRSTFPSSGRYGGHWTGDNRSQWKDLRDSIIAVQEFNMFGIPHVGADICGFGENTNEELCLRWHQLGAFYPFARNHNAGGNKYQDPALWPSVAHATRLAMGFRYLHLPYLFSLHFKASLVGGTVLRPVFFEFPLDPIAVEISLQFMWGPALLISPVTEQGNSSVQAYFPNAKWYSLYEHNYGQLQSPGHWQLPAPNTSMIPVHVRAGFILPRQIPAVTTTAARKNPFQLLIALDNGTANGELFWDDGESLPKSMNIHNYYHWLFNFKVNETEARLTIIRLRNAKGIKLPYLDSLEILGYSNRPVDFFLNGNMIAEPPMVNHNEKKQWLLIKRRNLLDLTKHRQLIFSWTHL